MQNEALCKHLFALLDGGHAHADLDHVTADMPFDKQGIVPENLPHSAWQILEHIRIALEDMVEYSNNEHGTYRERNFPVDYWPKSPAPSTPECWSQSVAEIKSGIARFKQLLADPNRDLFAPFEWGDGQTLLHEALQIADHNAYHLGEIVVVRQLLGVWRKAM